MRRVALGAVTFVLVACGASATASNGPSTALGEHFPIRLERHARAGARAHMTSETSHAEQTITTFGGQTVDSSSATSAFRFDGIVTVVSVDALGSATELRYEVRSFTHEEGARSSELLRAGQVIAVTTGQTRETARVLIDAAPASEELVHAIDEVLPVTHRDRDDDALFGSTVPRAVGEHWQADVFGVVRGLTAHSPLRVDPGHLRGEAQVVDRAEVDGVDGLDIAVVIEADRVQIDGLAPGASVREARVGFRVDGFFPLDEALPRLRESMQLHAEMAMSIATAQGAAEVALTMTIEGRRTFQPL